jgi:hypothetical protein
MKIKTIVYGSLVFFLGIMQSYETLGMRLRVSKITDTIEMTDKKLKGIDKTSLISAGTGDIMAVSLQLSEAIDPAYFSDLASSEDTVFISVPYYIRDGKKWVDAREIFNSIEKEARKVKKYTITGMSYALPNDTGSLTEVQISRKSARIKTTHSPLIEVPDSFDSNNPLGTLIISTQPYSIGG